MAADAGDKGPLILAIVWCEFAVAVTLVLARLYTNITITRAVRADTYAVCFALICGGLSTIFLSISVKYGTGQHIDEIDPSAIAIGLKYNWISQIIAVLTSGFGKVAVALLLLQILPPNKRRHIWFLYYVAISVLIVNATCVGLILAQCSPVHKLWDIEVDGSCNGRKTNQIFGYFTGGYSAVMDLALAVFPILIFWTLNLKIKVKVGLSLLMGLGTFAAVCSTVKTVELEELRNVKDFTYASTKIVIWHSSEFFVIIIAGSIPPLRPLMAVMWHRAKSLRHPTSSKTRNSSSTYGRSVDLTRLPKSHLQEGRTSLGDAFGNGNGTADPVITGKNESEEDILPRELVQPGIIKTTDIDVDWNNRQTFGQGERTSEDDKHDFYVGHAV